MRQQTIVCDLWLNRQYFSYSRRWRGAGGIRYGQKNFMQSNWNWWREKSVFQTIYCGYVGGGRCSNGNRWCELLDGYSAWNFSKANTNRSSNQNRWRAHGARLLARREEGLWFDCTKLLGIRRRRLRRQKDWQSSIVWCVWLLNVCLKSNMIM